MPQLSEAPATDNSTIDNASDSNDQSLVMDEFGRTEAERTVVLLSAHAEAVNVEVSEGKHDTYEDALAYIMERGLKEIERQRESARKQEAQRKAAVSLAKFNDLLAKQPALATKPGELIAALKAVGAFTPAIQVMLAAMGVKTA